MQIALYQPEIPQNTGTLLRLGACFDISVHIIEPCGFCLSDRRLRRAGMDYLDTARMVRHDSWEAFMKSRMSSRIVLLDVSGEQSYLDFVFMPDDFILLGSESCGVPQEVRRAVNASVRIPMKKEMRSLNVAIAGSMVLAEAMRQTGLMPN